MRGGCAGPCVHGGAPCPAHAKRARGGLAAGLASSHAVRASPPAPPRPVPPRPAHHAALPARFADARLQRSGRCHESEILRALQREMPQFRREGALDAGSMRQLVRNWQPDAERSSNGYWKNVSLRPGGGDAIAPAASAASLDASADQD